ncbi:hypothetical protein [Microbacterium marinum]|uniref:hypothetical protein n=1 Tax=Microbacterium marinum TaxID=421115 RepID=UPI00384BB385
MDSWAVDYGLITRSRLLGEPFHYRDERTAAGVDAVHARHPHADLFARNGLQFLPFNTLYQFAAEDPELLGIADHALLIPDLIGYWLTGQARTERTNASTTGAPPRRHRRVGCRVARVTGHPGTSAGTAHRARRDAR